VPVAAEVAGHPELAMGALAPGGVRVRNDHVIAGLGIPEHVVDAVAAAEEAELRRREHTYREGRAPPALAGRTVLLVDDGLATGASMRAAVAAVRAAAAARTVVAVPVGSRQAVAELAGLADEVVCPATPEPFRSVGDWYAGFDQTGDDEVRELLRPRPDPGPGGASRSGHVTGD